MRVDGPNRQVGGGSAGQRHWPSGDGAAGGNDDQTYSQQTGGSQRQWASRAGGGGSMISTTQIVFGSEYVYQDVQLFLF